MANVFIKQCFYEPMENYIREGIHAPVENPSSLDNLKVVDLLMKKPYGLLNLLDDEAKFPKVSRPEKGKGAIPEFGRVLPQPLYPKPH